MEAAARAACAHEIITALPQGHDTPLIEAGQIKKHGSHEELLKKGNMSADLYIKQLRGQAGSATREEEAILPISILPLSF